MKNKVPATYTITKKVLKQFNKEKGCYSKSALVEKFIIDFLNDKKVRDSSERQPGGKSY